MGVDGPAHRSGALKQSNKSHKTGRHRSKGAIDNEQKGKVSIKAFTRKEKNIMKKEQRRNQADQIRHNKRQEVLAKKRALGGTSSNIAPFLICLLPLNEQIDPLSALEVLKSCDPDAVIRQSLSGATHITIPRFKQRFSFIIPPVGRGNELTVLDYMKVCDTTLLLVSAITDEDDIFDRWGKRFIHMAVAQGIPTPTIAVMDLQSLAPNRRVKAKATIQKYIAKSFPEVKISTLETETDGLNMFRRIGGQKQRILHNKDKRPHLYAEQVQFEPIIDKSGGDFGTLKVTGFLRGVPLDVNRLVHIPGLGDFQMSRIDVADDDTPHKDITRRILADPIKQTSLQRENIPDEMVAEQTWPTEEEIAQARAETKKSKLIKRVPKGMSDYQACWIPDVEEKEDNESDEDMSDDDDEDEEGDFMSCESDKESADEFDKADNDEDCDTVTVSEAPINDEKYDLNMDLQEERETWQKLKEARSDQQWPDEIDTPLNVEARSRFEKYRGLESFRTSPWDPKENLPMEYARVYQFKNFDRTKRRILKENEDDIIPISAALPGAFITVWVANVSTNQLNNWKSVHGSHGLVIYGLLPHEHQMSVVNVVLKRTPDSTIPIRSKERMIVQCGYRRFIVNPIFSQHTNSDRHKFERYFRPGDTVVATFYAPIQFPPSPILCFQENPDTTLRLFANGTLLSCNPNRIILKRMVLSGHPFKINRRTATIRYMFHNKEDVEFFKPVKLRTRCGRMGHIKESLGTHGHMKCFFDGQLKSHDTVFMYLYKRVFPKWTYEDCIVSVAGSAADSEMN